MHDHQAAVLGVLGCVTGGLVAAGLRRVGEEEVVLGLCIPRTAATKAGLRLTGEDTLTGLCSLGMLDPAALLSVPPSCSGGGRMRALGLGVVGVVGDLTGSPPAVDLRMGRGVEESRVSLVTVGPMAVGSFGFRRI